MAFSALDYRSNAEKISFDPVRQAVTSDPVSITHGTNTVANIQPSPDEKWIVFDDEMDILLVRSDGTDLRKLTDDAFRDRHPRWSFDGKRIAFHSSRSGKYEIWSIQPDGSGLQQLTDARDDSLYYPVWSPDGMRIAASSNQGCLVFDISGKLPSRNFSMLAKTEDPNLVFEANDWSSDGNKLIGAMWKLSDGSYLKSVFFLYLRIRQV